MKFMKLSLLAGAAIFLSLGAPLTAIAQDGAETSVPQTPAVQMIPFSFADIAEKLTPAVVNISSTQKMTVPEDFPDMPQFPEGSPFQDFFNEFMEKRGGGMSAQPASSLGSGFIVDAEKGYIVTNNHVVGDAEDIRITLSNDVTIEAKIIGKDEKTDIAVLQVDTKDLKLTAVNFGNSDDVRVGDWTLAIGNPFGLGGTVTTGILSARQRDINAGPYDDFLQTDASINRGNSGGPLFNLKGEVIGINTAIFSPTGGSVGIGFAIPSALAQPVVKQIIQYGRTRRGWLGVRIQTVTEEIAESLGLEKPRGALVATVTKDGPAEEAGLETGDIILKLNGQEIKDMKTLPRLVAENDIDSEAEVVYWRDGKEMKAKVKIGELEKAEEDGLVAKGPVSEGTGVSIDSVGLVIKPMDDTVRSEFKIDSNVNGVVVSSVKEMSEAAEKGITAGDVIVEINQQPVLEPQEIVDIIKKATDNSRKSVLLLVNHGGDVRFVALRLGEE